MSKAVAKKLRAHKCKVGEFTHKPRDTVFRFYYASLADVRKVNAGRTGIRRA